MSRSGFRSRQPLAGVRSVETRPAATMSGMETRPATLPLPGLVEKLQEMSIIEPIRKRIGFGTSDGRSCDLKPFNLPRS